MQTYTHAAHTAANTAAHEFAEMMKILDSKIKPALEKSAMIRKKEFAQKVGDKINT